MKINNDAAERLGNLDVEREHEELLLLCYFELIETMVKVLCAL